jgi:hypothetical protein
MEMRVRVPDAASATVLAEWLSMALGAERILLRDERREVEIRVGDLDRSVLRVFDAVEHWLDQAGAGFAEMWLGERSYRLSRWNPVETWH